MRLDKFMSELTKDSRSQVKAYIKQGLVSVNGQTAINPQMHIDEVSDCITFRGNVCSYQKFHYYMLNKPMGVVSATLDNHCQTVTELIAESDAIALFPVGRLDKDTEGLLLLTDDGNLAHRLLSPKKHVEKEYLLETEIPLTKEQITLLTEGVDIGEKKMTMPAKVKILPANQLTLTIKEGKYHQIKRMMQAVGNRVTYLKRIRMGSLVLDDTLLLGDYRELSHEEICLLQEH